MQKHYIEILKTTAMNEEVEASFNFIVLALKTLKEQNTTISNNHVPLQLFAAGFERILKILLVIKDKYETGNFPAFEKARAKFQVYNNGHGIEKMLLEIIEHSENVASFQKIPMLIEDIKFLKNDIQFKKFIKIITEFSIQQRYYYIDTLVLGDENNNFNPFSEFKTLIWNFEEGVDAKNQTYQEEDNIKLLNTIKCIEKGTRAISRFFIHGFDDLGKMYYSEFSNFILLRDENLGKLKYSKKEISPSELYIPISSTSFIFLRIKIMSKSKTINQSDFNDWPFTCNQITVYAYKDSFYFAEIDKEIFALTGRTSSNYKIPLYFKSKHLKPRMFATYLLDEAKKISTGK